MKKLIIIFFILSICAFANAQFTVSSPNTYYIEYNNITNIDAVFLFNGISPFTEISYSGSGSKEWRKYDGTFVAYSNTDITFSPDDATGYILSIDGVDSYWIWVIDYALYPMSLNSLQVLQTENMCQTLTLTADISATNLIYYDKNNQLKTLTRSFTLDYIDYAFNGESWQDSVVSKTINYPSTQQFTVPAPKQNLTFTLSGDNFAKQMGIETSISVDYQAIAVESHLKGEIVKRSVPPTEKPNEKDRDISETNNVKGSAPLDVDFKSRANTPVAVFFKWIIYNNDNPLNYRYYNDENLHYTFQEDGYYTVKLEVRSSGGCTCIDSTNVETIASFINVPNVFSPNNDGRNDEFRIAYSSINRNNYKCIVFNRWGSVVFTSTDPNKGWDGNVRGKPAAEGTYYYVITATGTDKYSEGKNKGKIIKYNLKGMINLFR